MEPKLLFLHCIALLFRESQLEKRNYDSKEFVKEVLGTIKLPDTSIEHDKYREVLISLRSTVLHLIEQPSDTAVDMDYLLQRIRIAVGDDVALYEAFTSALKPLDAQSEIKRYVLRYQDELKTYNRDFRIRELLKKHYTTAHFSNSTVDFKALVDEVIGDLEPLRAGVGVLTRTSVVDEIDFSDLGSLEDAVKRSLEENTVEGMLMSGWQGINRMLGGTTYYRRGDFAVVGALQHNFKSGWMLNQLKHFALYNKPYMLDKEKKPMLLMISTENSVKDNLMWLYKNLKENETKELCDVRMVPPAEIARYVNERLSVNGYYVKMIRVNPSDYTYRDLFDQILALEADGFEIHACLFDYLNMISKKGCNQGPMGSDVRDLFRRVRNFTNPRGILFMTPHQLASDAKALLRDGRPQEDFVKEIANKGYWDSCRVIDQEVDLEIYLHIVKRDGVSYLCVMRGKHRKFEITAEKDLFCVFRFEEAGGILDDVQGEDLSLLKVGAKPAAQGGGLAWYDAA